MMAPFTRTGEIGLIMAKRGIKAHDDVANTLRAARVFAGEDTDGNQPVSDEEVEVAAEHRAQLSRPTVAEIAEIARKISK